MTKDPDDYFEVGCGRCSKGGTEDCKVVKWKAPLAQLRAIINSCGLQEQAKWGHPCYTWKAKNIAMIQTFNDYCAIAFFKGALLKDEHNLLVQPTENVQAGRQLRFTEVHTVIAQEKAIREYLFEAIEVENAGLKVEMKKTEEFVRPAELDEVLNNDSEYQKAFELLTPGRKRSYFLYFTSAKQSATRTTRIVKCKPKVLLGKGWNEY